MIKADNYCYIVSDKKLKGSGLKRGDEVYVTGLKVAPVSAKDPYLQRVYIHVISINDDGTHNVPKEDNENKVYLIDPRNVEKVSDERDKELREALRKQYG